MSEHPRMKLQGRVPVEQLDDERLTNIERKLVVAVSDMRAPASHSSWRLAAVAGMAMAVAVAGFVGYKMRGSHAVVPAPVASVDEPQTFTLNTDKANTLQLADATLTSGAGTDVVVTRSKHRIVIEMRRGTLDMAVAHDPSRLLVVRAGDTEIEDVGTRFSVDYDGAAKLAVRVTEGEVKVNRAGMHENITAGFAWTRDDGKLALAALDARMTATTTTTTTQIVAVAPVTPTPNDRGHVATVPHIVDSPTPTPTATPTVTPTTEPTPAPTQPTGAPHRGGTSNAKRALDKLPIEEPLDVGTKDFNTAIAKYLDLAVSMADSQDKTQVLYSMAVVQHRAHQDKAALYTLSGVIKRQGGKAYKAALWLNVRIECMQRFDDECRQAADLYLRKVPDGVAAGVAQEILTEIQRQ